MGRILYLPLTTEYFEAIKSKEKIFEYRKYSERWRKIIEGVEFDSIELMLGYPKKGDSSRRIIRPWRGYTVEPIVHKVFLTEEPVMCFCIRVN